MSKKTTKTNPTTGTKLLHLTVDNFATTSHLAACVAPLLADEIGLDRTEVPSVDGLIELATSKQLLAVATRIRDTAHAGDVAVAHSAALDQLVIRPKDSKDANRARFRAWFDIEYGAEKAITDLWKQSRPVPAPAGERLRVKQTASEIAAASLAIDEAVSRDRAAASDVAPVAPTEPDIVEPAAPADPAPKAKRQRKAPSDAPATSRASVTTPELKAMTMDELRAKHAELYGRPSNAARRILQYQVARGLKNIADGLPVDDHLKRWKGNAAAKREADPAAAREKRRARMVRATELLAGILEQTTEPDVRAIVLDAHTAATKAITLFDVLHSDDKKAA